MITPTELKTLKDFRKDHCEKIACGEGFVCEKCLKAEAVKWIKDPEDGFFHSSEAHANSVHWIMHFFNLTEEDLQ